MSSAFVPRFRGASAPRKRRPVLTCAALMVGTVLAGCSLGTPGTSTTSDASASGAGAASGAAGPVLADSIEPGGYSPLAGEGQYGQSMLYDGLLAMRSTGKNSMQELIPALATGMPTSSPDGRTWTVILRDGVTFSDGSTFGAEDVVATFEALLDPGKASEIRSSFEMIDSVEAFNDRTVVFNLRYPYAEFDSRLLMSIAPSELIGEGTAADQSLNTSPVGTGPYRLAEMTADRAVYEANPDYFGGDVETQRVTTVYMPDDNTRSQRMAAGEVDGALLPPTLASSVAGEGSNLELFDATTVDFRGIGLPLNDFASDVNVRRAINMAVDRQEIVDTVMSGHGIPTATPIPPAAGAGETSGAQFPYDAAGAAALLDEAGWVPGEDGIRVKDGVRAELPIHYPAADSLRGQIASAFTADMAAIGVQVDAEGTTWDVIDESLPEVGFVQAGGNYPMSTDSLAFDALHTRLPDASSPYTNPPSYGSPEMDALLEQARTELDPQVRAGLYEQVEQLYVEQPSSVFLAFGDHTYVRKPGTAGADTPEGMVIEPHIHSSTWGAWWNLGRRQ